MPTVKALIAPISGLHGPRFVYGAMTLPITMPITEAIGPAIGPSKQADQSDG